MDVWSCELFARRDLSEWDTSERIVQDDSGYHVL